MNFTDDSPFNRKCVFCGARRNKIAGQWAPICHRCGGNVRAELASDFHEMLTRTDEQRQETLEKANLDRTAQRQARRNQRAKENDEAAGCVIGCLVVLAVLLGISQVLGACGLVSDESSGRPASSYTQDRWLRCKDLLFGLDYPEDRLTPAERDQVTQCASG